MIETNLVVTEMQIEILSETGSEILVLLEEKVELISEAEQGPEGAQGERGLQGPPGGAEIQRIAATALSGHRVVLVEAEGKLAYASCLTLSHWNRIVGVTTGAASAGDLLTVITFGDLTEPSWAWQLELPVYLGEEGNLTQIPPVNGFSLVVGFPVSSTTLFINIREPIVLSN